MAITYGVRDTAPVRSLRLKAFWLSEVKIKRKFLHFHFPGNSSNILFGRKMLHLCLELFYWSLHYGKRKAGLKSLKAYEFEKKWGWGQISGVTAPSDWGETQKLPYPTFTLLYGNQWNLWDVRRHRQKRHFNRLYIAFWPISVCACHLVGVAVSVASPHV